MKKAIAVATLALVWLGSWVYASDNASIEVVMTLQSVEIVGNVSSLSVSAAKGTARVSDRVVFANQGSVAEDFSLKLTSTTGSWTPTSGTPGTDQYRLSAIWHHFETLKATMTFEFQTNDILTSTPQQSSDTTFLNDTDLHTTTGIKGYNVGVGEERNVFFKFDAPSSTVTANTSSAHVNVSAIAIP